MTANIYCRLCATKCDIYVNIYEDEGQKLNLATKITQCLQIWLYPEDTLPKTVCTNCCSKLNQYFDFFELCSQSQVSLKQMMTGEDNVKEEVTDVSGKTKRSSVSRNLRHEMKTRFRNDDDDDDDDNDDDVDNEDENDEEEEEEIDNDDDSDEDFKIQDDSNLSVEFPVTERRSSRRKLRTPVKRTSQSDEQGTPEEKQSSDKPTLKIKPVKRTASKRGRKQKVGAKSKTKNENTSDSKPPASRSSLEGYVWKCTDCPEEMSTLSALKTHHIEVHDQPPNYKCSQCTKVYTRYRSFARHVKLHGNPKKFSCDICGKCFSQKTVLQSHSTVHSEERPHVCPQCGKAFKQFSSLYLHSKCHLPDTVKPKFPCSACPKEFSTKHTLETHFKIHTGERNYVCDICGKSFIAKGSLDYHILTHNDTKPHSCPVCAKGFKTARLLTKHSTLHTGIKPHQCDVCGKQFRERGALKEHNRIHTGAMPYSCEFCGKMFRFKGILTVHRRQHTGERPYGCTDCRREFTNWANYNKHMKRRHRNSEHNSALASRILARQQLQTIIQPSAQEPSHLPPQPPPPPPAPPAPPPPPLVPAPALQQTTPSFTEHSGNSETTFNKLGEEHNSDVYRVPPAPPSYVPMTGMGYYIQPIHQHVLQARNQ